MGSSKGYRLCIKVYKSTSNSSVLAAEEAGTGVRPIYAELWFTHDSKKKTSFYCVLESLERSGEVTASPREPTPEELEETIDLPCIPEWATPEQILDLPNALEWPYRFCVVEVENTRSRKTSGTPRIGYGLKSRALASVRDIRTIHTDLVKMLLVGMCSRGWIKHVDREYAEEELNDITDGRLEAPKRKKQHLLEAGDTRGKLLLCDR